MNSKKGNISILVMFVLLASSLLGVLALSYIQQMMKSSSGITSYYKSYYLAKAGVELSLVEIKNRGIWFQTNLDGGSDFVIQNFLCGSHCKLTADIVGNSDWLSQSLESGCVHPFVLAQKESLVIPLFKDDFAWTLAEIFTKPIHYTNLAEVFKNDQLTFQSSWFAGNVIYGVLITSGEDLASDGIFFKAWSLTDLPAFRQQFEDYLATLQDSTLSRNYASSYLIDQWMKIYLLISNTDVSAQSFCVRVNNDPNEASVYLPTSKFFITSQWSFAQQSTDLNAVYAQPIPGFLLNTYLSY